MFTIVADLLIGKTVATFIKIAGKLGVKVTSGLFEVRNVADSGFVGMKCATPADNADTNRVATTGYVETRLDSLNFAGVQNDLGNLQGSVTDLGNSVTSLQNTVSGLSEPTGIVKEVEIAVTTNGTTDGPSPIPNNKPVRYVLVDVTTAYPEGTTMTVGFPGHLDVLVDDTDVNLTAVGQTQVPVFYRTTMTDPPRVTIAGNPNTGAMSVAYRS